MHINDFIKQQTSIFLSNINKPQNMEGDSDFINLVNLLCRHFHVVDYNEEEHFYMIYDEKHNQLINNNLNHETNSFVAARLHHYLFSNKNKKFNDGKIAYENYIKCVSKDFDFEFNCSCVFSAYYIYCSLGKQFDVETLKEVILNILFQVDSNDNAFALHFYNLLLDLELIELARLLTICENRMIEQIKINSFIFDGYYNLKEQIYKVEKEKKLIDNSQYLECIFQNKLFKADQYYELAKSTDRIHSKEHYLKICIKAYKECGYDDTEKFVNAKIMLDECEKEIARTMKSISSSIDSSKMFNILKEKVDTYNEEQNLRFLLLFMPIIKKVESEEHSLTYAKNSFSVHFFTSALVNSEGKTIAIIPPYNKDDEKIVDIYRIRAAVFEMQLRGQYIIQLLKLIKEKYPNINKLFDNIIEESSIVADKNKRLVKKGINFCYDGDFDAGLSILIPQIEASVRELAYMCGVSTYKLNQDNTEEANTLSSIIENKKFLEIIDEDIVFNLNSMFDSKYGLNLRNNFAHGHISNFNNYENVYAWWFYLVIICQYSGLK